MTGRDLFPEIAPYRSGRLRLDDTHEIYWEECGNPDGAPVVFLHGGPGSGCSPTHRRYFDPDHYRIVLFDQRGAGRSTPLGELGDNTTQHLVADIERLRDALGIDRWLVFGGSWGSTLALAYAQAHANAVTGLVLRGIFLGRRREIDWFVAGMARIFPEAWRAFAEHLPAAERGDLLGAYYARLTGDDETARMAAAHAWSRYEGACSTLLPDAEVAAAFEDDTTALGIARIEAHFFVNDCFLGENELLAGLDRIRHLPCAIVQGRYDIVCPIASADELARAWPEATYTIVPDAGHAASEPGTKAALIAATERFKSLTT